MSEDAGPLATSREPPDDQLRSDVRALGLLLGTVLREQGGEELLAAVEEIRHAAIERRTTSPVDLDPLRDTIDRLDSGRLSAIRRAFPIYFHLINTV